MDAVIGSDVGEFVPRKSTIRISHFTDHSLALEPYYRQDYGHQSIKRPAALGASPWGRLGAGPADRGSSDHPKPGKLQLPHLSPAKGEMRQSMHPGCYTYEKSLILTPT